MKNLRNIFEKTKFLMRIKLIFQDCKIFGKKHNIAIYRGFKPLYCNALFMIFHQFQSLSEKSFGEKSFLGDLLC